MPITSATPSRPGEAVKPRVKLLAVLLLTLAVLLALLTVAVAYGISREYADPGATPLHIGTQALGDWWVAVVAVVALGAGAVAVSRGSRGRGALIAGAIVTVLGTLVAVPAGAVVGAQQKRQSLPTSAECGADGFGPDVVDVVRDAQDAFDELRHPGWLGGGSAGVHGCESMLQAEPGADVSAAYVAELRGGGWEVTSADRGRVEAARGEQGFSARREGDGYWAVWIGPVDSAP